MWNISAELTILVGWGHPQTSSETLDGHPPSVAGEGSTEESDSFLCQAPENTGAGEHVSRWESF